LLNCILLCQKKRARKEQRWSNQINGAKALRAKDNSTIDAKQRRSRSKDDNDNIQIGTKRNTFLASTQHSRTL